MKVDLNSIEWFHKKMLGFTADVLRFHSVAQTYIVPPTIGF